MLYNANDLYVGRSLDLYGEFSEGEMEAFAQLVRPGDVAIDVGANIGTHTVALAQLVGTAGGVVAFEPHRILFQTLCANVTLNSLANVFCHNLAVGLEPGEARVRVYDPSLPQNAGATTVGNDPVGEAVSVVKLDELGLKKVRLIKVDVEGMELDVLRGGEELIATNAPTLYIENDRPEQSANLVRYIDSLGYDLYWHCPPLFNSGNFFGNSENVFADTISRNMLCMPKGSRVENLQRVPLP